MSTDPCTRCDGGGVICVEDRPYPNDVSPSTHEEPCPECWRGYVEAGERLLKHDQEQWRREWANLPSPPLPALWRRGEG